MKKHSAVWRSWLDWVAGLNPAKAKRSRSARRPRVSRAWRPCLERLEDRVVPATVTWMGGSGNWDAGANWAGGSVPRHRR